MTCGNNCRGVHPNSVIVGGIAVLSSGLGALGKLSPMLWRICQSKRIRCRPAPARPSPGTCRCRNGCGGLEGGLHGSPLVYGH